MAQGVLQPALTAGEVDPKILRPDMEQYGYGADKVRNAYLQPQGGVVRAPGWDFHAVVQSYDTVDQITSGASRSITLSYTPSSIDDIYVVGITTRNGVEFTSALRPILDYTLSGAVITVNSDLDDDFPGLASSNAEFYVVDLTSLVDASDANNVKLVKFKFSLNQQYALVFLPFLIHIYKKDAGTWTLQSTENIPATNDVVAKLTFTNQLDSLLIFAGQIPTQHLQRKGSDTDWEVSEWLYKNMANKTFFDTPVNSYTVPPTPSWLPGYWRYGAYKWTKEQYHEEALGFYNISNNNTISLYVNGVETAPITVDGSHTAITNHTAILKLTDNTGTFDIQLRKNNSDWFATLAVGGITRAASDATTATNIQTALNNHIYTAGGVTVVVSDPNEFTITFAGGDAGFLWSMRLFYDDEDAPIVDGGVEDYLEITQIGYPTATQTQVNLTEAIYAMDSVTSPPMVSEVSAGTTYHVLMVGEGDDRKEWFFLDGPGTAWDGPDKYITPITVLRGKPPQEATFSTRGEFPRGYPRAGRFLQGRLWVAGSIELPQFAWASRIGDPEDFDASNTEDAFGIEVEGDTNSVAAFYQMNAGRHLQLFSDDGEFYIPVDITREAITPTNVTLRRTTNKGTVEGLNVAEVDGATLFVQRDGKSFNEFVYTNNEEAYTISNVGAFAPHLINDPVDLAVQVSSDIDVATMLYLTLSSGDVAIFHYLRDGNVRGWSLRSTEGGFKAIEEIEDEAVAIVSRDLNGAGSKLYLEEQNFDSHVDCGKVATGVSVSTVNSGISHLNGEEVDIMADGVYYGRETVSGGTINFTYNDGSARTVTSYEIGLPFPVVDGGDGHVWVRTLPLALQTNQGTLMGEKNKVDRVDISVVDTQHLRVRHDYDRNYPAKDQITQLDFTGFSNADTFQLTVNGENTSVITYSTTPATNASNIQTALESLSILGVGDVTVTDLSGASDQMVLTFGGNAAGTLFDITPSVGSSSGTVDATNKTTGSPAIRARDNTVILIGDDSDLFDGPLYSGDLRVEGFLGYTKRGQVSFTQNVPGSLNITNITMQVRVN